MTTDQQMQLDLAPLAEPDYDPELTIEQRFCLFHAENPHVADTLEALAAEWLAAGNRRLGVKALVERARWESGLHTTGSAWRINNSFTSHYSRLLVQRHPEWADAIETRTLRSVA